MLFHYNKDVNFPDISASDNKINEISVTKFLSIHLDIKLNFVNLITHITWYLEEVLASIFRDRLIIGRCFCGFVLPVLEYCSAVWCSAADTHLKLLDLVVSDACFTAGGVLNCDLSHRRSVAVLCMLYKIRCNPMHPLCGALPVPCVKVRVTRGTLIAHRYTYAPPRCRTS